MMNKAQADIAYGFTTIVRSDPAYYAYTLMNNALGQYGIGGRLGDSIRERQGMAYYVFSSFDANVVEGPLIVRAGVNPANVDRAIASIDEEIRRMAEEGMTPDELADCKQYLIGSIPRLLETNSAIATFLHTAEFFGLGLDHDLRLPDLLNSVTLDDVRAAAHQTLDTNRASWWLRGRTEEKVISLSVARLVAVRLIAGHRTCHECQPGGQPSDRPASRWRWMWNTLCPASRFVLKIVRNPRSA